MILLVAIVIFSVPFISRYLGKIYPFNWETLYKSVINIKLKNKNINIFYTRKKIELLIYSIILTIFLATVYTFLSSNILLYINKNNSLISLLFFLIYIFFVFMFEIDKRYFIIPDIFSYPFILFSILFNSLLFESINNINITPLSLIFAKSNIDSAIGGVYGYFSAVIISILFYKKYPNALGNGDVKLLAAIGVLVGVNKLYQTIIISLVLFFLCSLFFRKRYMPLASVLFPAFLLQMLYVFLMY